MILLSRYSWLGRYLWVARCCWSVSSWKSPSSAVGGTGRVGLEAMQSKQSPGAPCCRHVPALTLQQVGDEQRRALVTAGQPPQRQVLLDLECEEIPAEGTGDTLRGDSSWAPAQHSQAVPMPLPALACALAQGMQVWGGHRRSVKPLPEPTAEHHHEQHAPAI